VQLKPREQKQDIPTCGHKKQVLTCIVILNKQKCLFFFSYKIEEQEGRMGPVWKVGTSGRKEVGKGVGG
jgi:hypothetical protein